MRVAVTLGGTDRGRSGLGVYVRAILPPLVARLSSDGGSLVALAEDRDLDAYDEPLRGADRVLLPPVVRSPAASALWHLLRAGPAAAAAEADVLLLPAANRRLTARSPVPTVAVVHDLANLHVPGKYDPLRMAYLRWVMLGALGRASVIVAVSNATRDDLVVALGARAGRVRVVPNGVDAARFAPLAAGDPAVARVRARVGLTAPYVLYPSRLEHPGKNHLRLLGAWARSGARRTHLLALSGGDWGARARIEAEIDRLGLRSGVILLGWVAEEDLPPLLAAADAVLMVGLHEGFGLPALEALAAGRPVCVSRTGALPEVVGGLGALCDPLDEGSIAGALDRALTDPALRARCSLEGPAHAASRDWRTTADGLWRACADALHRRP